MLTFKIRCHEGLKEIQILIDRADLVDVGFAESSEGTREVDKTESQNPLQVQSREETKTKVSMETLTDKYVPVCLSQNTENADSYTMFSLVTNILIIGQWILSSDSLVGLYENIWCNFTEEPSYQ